MLISELNEFTGTLGASDYFAIDNGTDTRKVSSQAIVNKILSSVREIFYGTSSTSASTSTKVVSCSGFTLKTGAVIAVKFTYAQTSTASIYLNVNGTGAKQVYGIPRATTSTSRLDGAWEANEVKFFVYDGSYWRIVSQNIITTSQLATLETMLGLSGTDSGRLFQILNKLSGDDIIDSGTTDDWNWKKYASGAYEAEMLRNEGSFNANIVLATVEGSVKLYATSNIPLELPNPPHTLTSGSVIAMPTGNSTGWGFTLSSSGGRFMLGRLATSDTFVFNNVNVLYRVVGGRWQ